MRLLLQRVRSASVRVDQEVVGQIAQGLLVFVGVEAGDGPAQVAKAADKLLRLRLFGDREGRMNLDVTQVAGEILVVSQFTLVGSLARGRRPSFDKAAPPDVARPLVDSLCRELGERGLCVARGRFGAHMEVELINDGPVTFVLDV